MYRDQYDILGIEMNATARDILLAFRRLARRYHPDVNRGDVQSVERFNEISNAYQLLSDSDRRKEYDLFGQGLDGRSISEPPLVTGTANPIYPPTTVRRTERRRVADINDLVQSVLEWGDGSSRRTLEELFQRQKIDIPVSISLEEAYLGTRVSIHIDGSSISPGRYAQEIQIAVPAGVADGSRIHVGREIGRNGTFDVYGLISVKPHKWYVRAGNDLFVKLPVHFSEMILGEQLRLSLLNGDKSTFVISPGTQNGQTFKLKGKGMPRLNAPHLHGDLYIEVEAFFPFSLDQEEIELLRQVHDLWVRKNSRHWEAPRHASPSDDTHGA